MQYTLKREGINETVTVTGKNMTVRRVYRLRRLVEEEIKIGKRTEARKYVGGLLHSDHGPAVCIEEEPVLIWHWYKRGKLHGRPAILEIVGDQITYQAEYDDGKNVKVVTSRPAANYALRQ